MHGAEDSTVLRDRLFGWLGTLLLLGILPVKLVRFVHVPGAGFATGIAPSLLGPAGLLFLLLAGRGPVSRMRLNRLTLGVAALAVALELAQLLPRPGWLARVHYTFDGWDLAATVVSVALARMAAAGILRRTRPASE